MNLLDELTALPGIGKKKALAFADVGIRNLKDLLFFFPRTYQDRRRVTSLREAKNGKAALIVARVCTVTLSGNPYNRKAPLKLVIEDGSGETGEVIFFGGRYLKNLFQSGAVYAFYGKVSLNYGRKQLIHPEFARAGSPEDKRAVLPIYRSVSGISQNEMRKLESLLIPLTEEIEEWYTPALVEEFRLIDPGRAVRAMHFPEGAGEFQAARYRLLFDELLELQCALALMRSQRQEGAGVVIDPSPGAALARELPFALTVDQKKAWEEIATDLASDKPMNRLLQGDVGSGKTVLAEMAMLASAKSGFQAVLMAPTELLASQHMESFARDLAGKGVRVALLLSHLKPREKREILQGIETGEIALVIATHAVLQDNVHFHDLGLVITDEQHRFGVSQRKTLAGKGKGINVLLMTATPIPRTLAVLLYGGLAVSQIRTMPKGRLPVKTACVRARDRKKVYNFVRKEVERGHRAYVVAPLIEDSDVIDAGSVESIFDDLKKWFPDFSPAFIHGAMPQEEKDRVMADFAAGRISILVSTVVIEVGINVPEASVMVIENAERFGLAQMHQLRGRVGRGRTQSYCFLILGSESEIALERAKIMTETTDGFLIAEEDLRLRGPGEIFGTRQHGIPGALYMDILRHPEVLRRAGSAAEKILQFDPRLETKTGKHILRRIEKLFGDVNFQL